MDMFVPLSSQACDYIPMWVWLWKGWIFIASLQHFFFANEVCNNMSWKKSQNKRYRNIKTNIKGYIFKKYLYYFYTIHFDVAHRITIKIYRLDVLRCSCVCHATLGLCFSLEISLSISNYLKFYLCPNSS